MTDTRRSPRHTLGHRLLTEASEGRLAPGSVGGDAWAGFLTTYASLLRLLDTELRRDADLSLSDFDVLIQLALADGSLSMTELARRSLVSRSGMTRRVAQLEQRGLVRRAGAEGDGRSVQAALTPTGADVLRRAVPAHVRGIDAHFLCKLDEEQLSNLRESLAALRAECDFG
jgi:DNA-binding MarR family transcriptional regulator